jgi:hypothetical protein
MGIGPRAHTVLVRRGAGGPSGLRENGRWAGGGHGTTGCQTASFLK